MKTISLPGKDLFLKSTPWLPARAQRSWLSNIGHSPEALHAPDAENSRIGSGELGIVGMKANLVMCPRLRPTIRPLFRHWRGCNSRGGENFILLRLISHLTVAVFLFSLSSEMIQEHKFSDCNMYELD